MCVGGGGRIVFVVVGEMLLYDRLVLLDLLAVEWSLVVLLESIR